MKSKIYPLYKWQGGKTKMIKKYGNIIENVSGETYVEPFFGGGALFCHFYNKQAFSNYIISDKNKYIIDLLKAIKHGFNIFTSALMDLESKYLSLSTKKERKDFYYKTRERYYLFEDNKVNSISKGYHYLCSALLYFLMKTSFNGIWQPMKSRNNYYGTAFGLGNEKVSVFDYNLLKNWHVALQCVEIQSTSYEKLYIPKSSLVFCDPPYLDETVTYGEEAINTVNLLRWCEIQNENGCEVLMSNRHMKDSYYETFCNYDEKHVFDVSYTGGKKSEYNNKEVLIIWHNQTIPIENKAA